MIKFTLTSILLIAAYVSVAQNYQNIGGDLAGARDNSRLGNKVAITANGTGIVLGETGFREGNVVPGDAIGRVRVFELVNNQLQQVGQDILGTDAGDRIGTAVDIDDAGNTIAIGANFADFTGGSSGFVAIYDFDGNRWEKRGETITATGNNDQMGSSLSLTPDGNTVAIGSFAGRANGLRSGESQVYDWDGAAWIKRGNSIVGNQGDELGISIDISDDGNTYIVGSTFARNASGRSGTATVYEYDGTNWIQKGQVLEGKFDTGRYGSSTAINTDGTIVAAGGYSERDEFSRQRGNVRMFIYDGSQWIPLGQELTGNENGGNFGISIDLNRAGDIVTVGANRATGDAAASGQVSTYRLIGNAWTPFGGEIYGMDANEFFGSGVAIDALGNTIVAGGFGSDVNGRDSGIVRVYQLDQLLSQIGQELNYLHFYPNPVVDKLYIEGDKQIDRIELYDITGKFLMSQVATRVIDLTALRSGVYLVRFNSGNESVVKKILKI